MLRVVRMMMHQVVGINHAPIVPKIASDCTADKHEPCDKTNWLHVWQDDGVVKIESLLRQQDEWIDCLRRIAKSAIKAGDFRDDIDCDQFAFDLYSLLLGFHYYYKLLNDKKTRQRQKCFYTMYIYD